MPAKLIEIVRGAKPMHPNVTLAGLRNAIEAFRNWETVERTESFGLLHLNAIDAAERMAEYAEALDRWLTRGGFLPDDWKRNDA